MKFWIMAIGLLGMAFGLKPILQDYGYLPTFLEFIPATGIINSLVVTVVGAVLVYVGFKRL